MESKGIFEKFEFLYVKLLFYDLKTCHITIGSILLWVVSISTFSACLGQGHMGWTRGLDMLVRHAHLTHWLDMPVRHSGQTRQSDTPVGHVGQTCQSDTQVGHSTWTR